MRRRDMPTCFVFRVSCVKNSLPWLNAVLRVEENRHLHAAHGGQRLVLGPMSSQRFHIAYVIAPGNLVPAGARVVGPTAALGTK